MERGDSPRSERRTFAAELRGLEIDNAHDALAERILEAGPERRHFARQRAIKFVTDFEGILEKPLPTDVRTTLVNGFTKLIFALTAEDDFGDTIKDQSILDYMEWVTERCQIDNNVDDEQLELSSYLNTSGNLILISQSFMKMSGMPLEGPAGEQLWHIVNNVDLFFGGDEANLETAAKKGFIKRLFWRKR